MPPLLGRQPARWHPGDFLPPAGLYGLRRPEGGAGAGGRPGGQGQIPKEGDLQKEAVRKTARNATEGS